MLSLSERSMALPISEVSFPLTIPNISKLDKIESSETTILGVPWKVEFSKSDGFLFILFRCEKKDNLSQWSYAAQTSVKLLSFDPDQKALEKLNNPYVFSNLEPTQFNGFTTWTNLFEEKNKYVKNDTMKLEVNIKIVDPNDAMKSMLTFEPQGKCCEGCSATLFQLTVTNIDELMAVQTPSFLMRNHPLVLTVYKCRPSLFGRSYLVVKLSTTNSSIVGNVRTIFKLMSSNPNIALKKEVERMCPILEYLTSWNDLLDPKNGYVNNNSIVIEVLIKMDKPQETVSVGKKRRADNILEADENLIRLECAICLENINKNHASSTTCGHIFCTDCIKGVIQTRKRCPSCNKIAKKIHRVFLPM